MLKKLEDLRRGVAAADDKAARCADAIKATELRDVARDRKAHAVEYETAVVAWSLPAFSRRRKAALAVAAANATVLAGALGAPGCAASPSDVAAATRVLLSLALDVPFLKPRVDDAAPPPPPAAAEVAV